MNLTVHGTTYRARTEADLCRLLAALSTLHASFDRRAA